MPNAVSIPDSLREVLSENELRWMAGEQSFIRGQDLAAHDAVQLGDNNTMHFSATVNEGVQHCASVSLLRSGDIEYRCDCEAGQNELFCCHCVAASLVWLSRENESAELWSEFCLDDWAETHEDAIDRIGRKLSAMSRESLVETLLNWAEINQGNAQTLSKVLFGEE